MNCQNPLEPSVISNNLSKLNCGGQVDATLYTNCDAIAASESCRSGRRSESGRQLLGTRAGGSQGNSQATRGSPGASTCLNPLACRMSDSTFRRDTPHLSIRPEI